MLRTMTRIWNTRQRISPVAFILAVALAAGLIACGGISGVSLAAKEAKVMAYESRVEGSISYECEQQEEVAKVLAEWDDLDEKYGRRDYYDMSDSEKMQLLNDVEGILKKLEQTVKDAC